MNKLVVEDGYKHQLELLNEQISKTPQNDELYYLRGKLYHGMGNWKEAIENYMEAIHRNPESPAITALTITTNILEFYNKDIFCQ